MPESRQYIGINGIDVTTIEPTVHELYRRGIHGAGPGYLFGVKASTKTQLFLQQNRYGNLWYPVGNDIANWFLRLRAMTFYDGIVHLNSDSAEPLALLGLARLIDERCTRARVNIAAGQTNVSQERLVGGYQFNDVDWVSNDLSGMIPYLAKDTDPYAEHPVVVILQANADVLRYSPDQLAKAAKRYDQLCDLRILLDGSGGQGIPLNQDFLLPYCEALYQEEIAFGIAGGLNGDTVEQLAAKILRKYPKVVSVDGESGFRDNYDSRHPAASRFSPLRAANFAQKVIQILQD